MKISLTLFSAAIVAPCLFIASCSDDDDSTSPTDPSSSFDALQTKVLTPTCATSGCHDSETQAEGLDLSSGVAYQNLVGVAPTNETARDQGLERIKANAPEESLLLIKTDKTRLDQTTDLGALMPEGSQNGLSAGINQFIEEWIEAGAPSDGVVADESLLDD